MELDVSGYESCSWLSVEMHSAGSERWHLSLSIESTELSAGVYNCELIVNAPAAENSPQSINVTLTVRIPEVLSVPEIYSTIQDAVDAADYGDTVVLSDGIYTGEGNRDIRFDGKTITVKSENGPENCIIDCQGTEQEPHRGFTVDGSVQNTAVIEGITIENGYGPSEHNYELMSGSSGGAIYSYFNDIIVRSCIIRNNTAEYGAGIYTVGTNAVVDGCQIIGNNALATGSGIYSDNWFIRINNCSFRENFNTVGSFHGDQGYLPEDRVDIFNCVISDNEASKWLMTFDNNDCNIDLCTITDNVIGDQNPVVIDYFQSTARISNSVVWGNGFRAKGAIRFSSLDSELDVSYSLIEQGRDIIKPTSTGTLTWGAGNIEIDPGLTLDGFHLRADSPCINAGDPAVERASIGNDIDGESRVDDRVDIGADEFVDSDSDQMPDWWEEKCFGSATGGAAEANPDDDEWTNAEEYVRQTNPKVVSTCYVDADEGDDGWNGLAEAWDGENGPKKTIQAAIDASHNGQVVLKPGRYVGDGNRDISFRGKRIIVRSVDPDDWEVVGQTVIDVGASWSDYHRGFVFEENENKDSVLEGVTITNGLMAEERGGGIYCESSPVIRRCVIENNIAQSGAGVYSRYGWGTVSNCIVRNNMGIQGGGFRIEDDSVMTILNCLICSNRAIYGVGGGILNSSERDQKVINCTITNNIAGSSAGVFYSTTNPKIVNSIVWGNFTWYGVGNISIGAGTLSELVSYSCIGGLENWDDKGVGNFGGAPGFVEAGQSDDNGDADDLQDYVLTDGDYHLTNESFCLKEVLRI